MMEEKWKIESLNEACMEAARKRWDGIATPLRSLGKLEDVIVQCAGIFETDKVEFKKKATIVMCADNGIVAEGVTQSGQEVTKIVAENMTSEKTTVALMSRHYNGDVFVVDIGMASDSANSQILNKKVMYGTHNFALEPAMSREQAMKAIQVGIDMVGELKSQGYKLIATGEMGIGNTTTSSAITACLLEKEPSVVTGRGAGLSSQGLDKKIRLIEEALEKYRPDKEDMIDVLSKVGGLDIAGICGVFIGGAIYRIPILIDGFISSTAALVAQRIEPCVKNFMFPSHVSAEPAGKMVLEALGFEPMLCLNMCLGEGTGAVMTFGVFDMGAMVYNEMYEFKDVDIEAYVPLV